MEVKAISKNVRISASKGRDLARAVVGKRVGDALKITEFSPRKAAFLLGRTIKSAAANASHNDGLDVDALVVAEASVGKSVTMKRFHTRGRGKSTRILKPFSRLRIVVRESEEA